MQRPCGGKEFPMIKEKEISCGQSSDEMKEEKRQRIEFPDFVRPG